MFNKDIILSIFFTDTYVFVCVCVSESISHLKN